MNTAASSVRLRPTAIFALITALSLTAPPPAFGQTKDEALQQSAGERIQKLVTDLGERRTELEELDRKVAQNPDNAAAVILRNELSTRRERFRRDLEQLVELVLGAEDAGTDSAQGRATAEQYLDAEAQLTRERLDVIGKEALALVDVTAKGSPEDARKARADLGSELWDATRLIKYLHTNIGQQRRLGLDVQGETDYLVERLRLRGDVTAGFLKSTKEEIDELASRPGVDKDTEAQKQLASLRKQRDVLAKSQRVNVDLMDAYGLKTAELRQGLIVATGKLSQDILDKDVAAGLLETAVVDAADWLRSNGASLIFQVLAFLLLLFAFWVVARIGRGLTRRALERSSLKISSLARDFFIKTTGRLILIFGFIIALAQLGIEIGPLLAGLGIAGFILGFALQDTLSNFASGMLILVYRPFDVGDVIEAGGVMGKVDKMNLVSTMVLTFDNQLLVVPNKQIWSGVIRNVTHQDKRRVDMTFSIGYSDDIPKAEEVLAEIIGKHEMVLKDPEPVIRLHTLGESAVDFIVRPWAKTDEYWDVYWDVTREVKRRFDAEGITIPFPQRDVHIYRDGGGDNEAGA